MKKKVIAALLAGVQALGLCVSSTMGLTVKAESSSNASTGIALIQPRKGFNGYKVDSYYSYDNNAIVVHPGTKIAIKIGDSNASDLESYVPAWDNTTSISDVFKYNNVDISEAQDASKDLDILQCKDDATSGGYSWTYDNGEGTTGTLNVIVENYTTDGICIGTADDTNYQAVDTDGYDISVGEEKAMSFVCFYNHGDADGETPVAIEGVAWEGGNTDVATIEGNTVLKTHGVGTTTFTGTLGTGENQIQKTITVNVKTTDYVMQFPDQFSGPSGLSDGYIMSTDDSFQVFFEKRLYDAEGGSSGYPIDDVQWSVDKTDIAEVTVKDGTVYGADHKYAEIKAKKAGQFTLTCRIGDITKTATIDVKEPGVYVKDYTPKMTITAGNWMETPGRFEFVGPCVTGYEDGTLGPWGMNMVLEDSTIQELKDKGLSLGDKNLEGVGSFTPKEGYHTLESL